MTGENKILKVQKVSVNFSSKKGQEHKALDNVSFSLEQGRTLAIVGESGSGKTTLLKVIIGLIKPTSGQIFLSGHDINAISPNMLREIRRTCGYIPQDPYGAIPPGLNVLDAVTEPAIIIKSKMPKEEQRKRAFALLSELGLNEERILKSRVVGLSGGQRQRVGIARALMISPKILFCDEPTSMQDVSTRGEIIEILEKRTALGMSMIFVTHDIKLASHAAESVIVMKNGQICEEGNSSSVLSNPKHDYTKALLRALPKIP